MKISLEELRKVVREELELIQENLDHQSIKSVVNSASSLLHAIDKFNASEPTAAQMTGVNTLLSSLRKSLEDMIQNPTSYVDRPSPKVLTIKKPKGTP
jgi:hypothetical protein